jgi:predicted  nucleic acid-binding Zn-ribbon protein
LVSPAQEKNQIEENLKDLENLHQKLEHELEELNEVIKALNKQTQQALTTLREEIKATEGKFGPQIEKVKAALEERRSKINKEYSDKVTQASDKYEQELVAIRKEIITLQKTNEQTNSEIASAENEIRTARINKDDDAEQKWKEKRNELKKHLPEVSATIKNFEIKVQETQENKKNAMFQLKQENDAAMKEAGKDLIEIESSSDAEIKNCQSEMEKIEDATSTIIGKIDKLTKISETAINEFQNLGIRFERASSSLVYMPFYLICYQTGSNKRCTYLAPSVASSISIGAKFRALGKSKIKQLFQPKSQRITSKLNIFLTLLDENIAFSHEINEACSKANLLGSKERVELIKNGLNQLRTDGWLSDSEFEYFGHLLS